MEAIKGIFALAFMPVILAGMLLSAMLEGDAQAWFLFVCVVIVASLV